MNDVYFSIPFRIYNIDSVFHCYLLDPPKFVTPPSYTAVGNEGEPIQIALQANANPMSISYTWTKDGVPLSNSAANVERIVADGAVLNITRLTRNDAGIYTCEAVNSQGSATINITVIVECKYLCDGEFD